MLNKLFIIHCSLLIIHCSLFNNLQCQNIYLFRSYEDSLKKLSKDIFNGENDSIKLNANNKFLKTFLRALTEDNSYKYPFDSLLAIPKLVSPDNNFRIFTWTLVKENGNYKYYGLIQFLSDKNYKNTINLIDKSESINMPENVVLTDNNWYGAVYYKIIYEKYKRKHYYTFLGWKGNNLMSRKKVIEVLTFDSDNKPVFGGKYFKTIDAEPKRIIFEYSSDAVMSLKYEQQSYTKIKGQSIYAYDRIDNIMKTHKKRNFSSPTPKTKKIKAWMIVFDRLIPLNPGLEGQHEFYVPSVDYVDALIFRSGMWRIIADIDARNPKENDSVKKSAIKSPDNK